MHHRRVLYDKDDFDFVDRTNTNYKVIKIVSLYISVFSVKIMKINSTYLNFQSKILDQLVKLKGQLARNNSHFYSQIK
jgi:hypothetical protein